MNVAAAKPAWTNRIIEWLLVILIFAGSLVLVAMPLAWLWLLSQLDLTATEFYLSALLGCPIAIAIWAFLLIRLNALHLAVTSGAASSTAWLRRGGVLEGSVTVAVLIGVVLLAAWLVLGSSGGPALGP